MILPAFIKRSRFGIYYLRFVVSSKVLARFDDIQREYRVSLNTNKKQDALYFGSALFCIYKDIFQSLGEMSKFEWDGKEIEPAEWLARTLQKNRAEAALKKARNKGKRP
jgi:hypothetical protein